jgi:trimethylamine:corrinoid methyltransferase-like protein
MPYAVWEGQDVQGMEAKAREKARRILSQHQPRPLDTVQEREINAIVAAARVDPVYA